MHKKLVQVLNKFRPQPSEPALKLDIDQVCELLNLKNPDQYYREAQKRSDPSYPPFPRASGRTTHLLLQAILYNLDTGLPVRIAAHGLSYARSLTCDLANMFSRLGLDPKDRILEPVKAYPGINHHNPATFIDHYYYDQRDNN